MQKSKAPDWKGVRCLMVVLIGLLLFIYIGKFFIGFWAFQTSDTFFAIEYKGWENFLHVPVEYYAIKGDYAFRVSSRIVEHTCSEEELRYAALDQNESILRYNLCLENRDSFVESDDKIILKQLVYPDKVLYYQSIVSWTPKKNESYEKIFLTIMNTLLKDNTETRNGSVYAEIAVYGTDWLISCDGKLYEYKGEQVRHLMDIPPGGELSAVVLKKNMKQ